MSATVDDLFEHEERFVLPQREVTNRCRHARAFAEYVNTWLLPKVVTDNPSLATLYQAMLELTKTYFKLRNQVPKLHRNHLSEQGHICIYQTFVETWEQLARMEALLQRDNPFFLAERKVELPLLLGFEERL